MTGFAADEIVADLRTAQNRMFSAVALAVDEAERQGKIKELLANDDKVTQLYELVRHQVLALLAVPEDKRSKWYMGIVDSGKRAIEALVSYYCPAESGVNVVVSTENYVAFNKFSAAVALQNQKECEFLQPFSLEMGQALTVDSEEELAKAKVMIQSGEVKTLWIAWNSTSTGVKESVEQLVAFRNQCNSQTLIVSDAASLPLFSTRWQQIASQNLPDVFFFSLRKQGLPYDGPQDEANQARNSGAFYLFNERALNRAAIVQGPSLYDTPTPKEAVKGQITIGVQRPNHIRHLLKLEQSLAMFLVNNSRMLIEREEIRQLIGREIRQAFVSGGQLAELGFALLARDVVQSESAYIVRVPENVKPSDMLNQLKERGIQVSLSMHPRVPNDSYFRFACYPATSLEEVRTALTCFSECV